MNTSRKHAPLAWRWPSSNSQILIFLLILGLLCVGAAISAQHIHDRTNIDYAQFDKHLGSSIEYSAAICWLVIANLISALTVFSLKRELRTVERATRNITFTFLDDAEQTLGIKTKNFDNPLTYALAPLDRIYYLSSFVIFIILALGVAIYFSWPLIDGALSNFLIVWTGLVYVLIMTLCDYAARESFRRLSSMQVDPTTECPEEKRLANLKNFDDLCEALGDFERMIRYVDYPFFAGSVIILVHKFYTLQAGSYYFGFIAGAIAMHTILANLVALSITLSAAKTEP